MIVVFIFICLVLTIFLSDNSLIGLGVSNEHLCGAFTYSFSHTSLLHLAINAMCLVLMYKPIYEIYTKRFGYVNSFRFFLSVYSLSVVAAFLAALDTPTIGASGLVFTLLGMLIVLNPTLRQLKAYGYVAASILLQIILGHSNVLLHVCAFVFGALAIIIRTAYDNIRIHSCE